MIPTNILYTITTPVVWGCEMNPVRTVRRDSHRLVALAKLIGSKILNGKTITYWKGRFGLWWRRLLDFLSRSDGGSCPNKKNSGRRNAIWIYIPVANSFTPERAFSVTKLPFRDAKFLSNRTSLATVIFLEFRPCNEGWIWLFPAKIISEKSWKTSDANSRLHSISRVFGTPYNSELIKLEIYFWLPPTPYYISSNLKINTIRQYML